MRGETSSYAAISRTITLDFGFPYSNGSTGELTLRRTGEDVAVMLEIDKGQFTCFKGEASKVVKKFDAGEVLHYSCDHAADDSSNIVFLGPEQMILRQLRDAQQLVIEAQFFRERSRKLTFHVAGLKW